MRTSTVEDIQNAVSELEPDDLAKLRAWFEEFHAAAWDKQFEDDVRSGKLGNIANKAVADFERGEFKEL